MEMVVVSWIHIQSALVQSRTNRHAAGKKHIAKRLAKPKRTFAANGFPKNHRLLCVSLASCGMMVGEILPD
jgi:hypothetical protein